MIDLERLITKKQDELRGRPRDWLDDFKDWRERTDFVGVTMIGGSVVLAIALLWYAP